MHMPEKHPTYKHPIIQEALCALHFTLGENREWKSSFFGDFYRSIESDYPHIEPGVNVGVEFHVKESEISQVLSQPRQMMKFTHKSGKKLMQLFPHMLTINELPVYPGWKEMSDDIIHALNNLQKPCSPSE